MIDTDKYEGHTEGPWIPQVNSQVSTAVHANAVHYVPSRAVTIIATVEYNHPQNKALIADAPLLLAEVKRLHAILHDYFICPECAQKKCDGECEGEDMK